MKCSVKTNSGKACQARATASGKCSLHADPSRAAELARRSRTKRNRFAGDDVESAAQVEIPQSADEVRSTLAKVMVEIYSGKLDTKIGTAVGYISNVLLRAIEVSDLAERVSRLEGTKP